MRALFGCDQAVAEWVGNGLRKPIHPPYTAIGWVDEQDNLRAGAVFNQWNGSNIEVTIYGPRGFGKEAIQTVFRYAFTQLKANRLTATTERRNKVMRRILPRMGFIFEHPQQQFYGPRRENDGLVFRMLRNECRWL